MRTGPAKDLAQLLTDKGFKITPQRVAILEFMYGNDAHPSVDQIYEQVKRRFRHISRATVYNTIKSLTEAGLLQEILLQQDKAHFDWNVSRHHHFKCLKCGRVEDIDYRVLTPSRVASQVKGYTVQNVRVTMEGLCKRCT
jgi:Fur family peroxide stress response transcriptional regulator